MTAGARSRRGRFPSLAGGSFSITRIDWAWSAAATATALEGLARAHACVGEVDEARKLKGLAREAGDRIVNPQGRATSGQIMERGPWYGV